MPSWTASTRRLPSQRGRRDLADQVGWPGAQIRQTAGPRPSFAASRTPSAAGSTRSAPCATKALVSRGDLGACRGNALGAFAHAGNRRVQREPHALQGLHQATVGRSVRGSAGSRLPAHRVSAESAPGRARGQRRSTPRRESGTRHPLLAVRHDRVADARQPRRARLHPQARWLKRRPTSAAAMLVFCTSMAPPAMPQPKASRRRCSMRYSVE